ncbi:acetyl-CoA synthetase-like protein [Colletotrichum caudatum]|nr:acetyl-CoA synthetase-like protein [Colletotrichum caudatum]
MDVGPWTRSYNFSAYTFDTSISDIFLALVKGGCVVVPSEHDRLNDLAGSMARLRPNFALLTPTVLGFLDPGQVKCLQTVAATGEALGSSVSRRWTAAGVRLLNAYGPAETAVLCAVGEVATDGSDPANIGRAIGSAAWITSPGNPEALLPIGCVGEILIEGPILASGYLGDREKTAAVFLPSTGWLARHSNGRRSFGIYRTGDLGVFNQDGSITYMGRTDSQIKINGQRVELAEIEYHLTSIIKDRPVAAGVVNRGGRSKIVAFIAKGDEISKGEEPLLLDVTPELAIEAKKIIQGLASVLPSYMTPSAFIPVSYMPKAKLSMKTDRRPLQEKASAISDETFHRYCNLRDEPLRTENLHENERLLLSMWESVLGKKFGTVSREEQFSRLGGDSVSAMRLSRVARSKGYRLGVRSIIMNDSLRDMAADMQRLESEPKPHPTPSHAPDGLRSKAAQQLQVAADQIEDIYPCSALQSSMFAASLGTSDLYVNCSILKRVDSLDVDRFIWAWNTAVAAMPILRTRIFQDDESQFHQAILVPAPLQGPEEPESQYFVWVMHHCLYDGPTYDMIISVVNEIYRSGRNSLRLLPYSNFIEHIQKGQGEETAEFWRKYLGESICVALPRTRSAPTTPSTSFSQFEARLQVPDTQISSAVLSAALALVLSRYTGTCDLTFNTVRGGRDIDLDGIETILGPTISTVPTRVRWAWNQTVSSFLRRLQSEAADMIPHQHFGLHNIARATESKACASDVLLVVQRGQGSSPQLEGHRQVAAPMANFHTHPLNIECILEDGGPRVVVQYDPSVITEEEVQLLMWQLDFVSTQLCRGDEEDKSLGEIVLLSPQERERILAVAGDPVVPVKTTVSNLFRNRALENPESLAVVGRGISFTYAELDKLSDQLSCYLLGELETAHQEQQHYVGLVFEHSPMYVASMIAVLKTPRAAFVPIDPAWPDARISEVAERLGMRQILVSETQLLRISRIVKDSHPIVVAAEMPSRLKNIGHESSRSPTLSDVAYVIFTSGTTATPKGVVIEEGALATSLYNRSRVMGVSRRTRTLQFSSHAFDASLDEILIPLVAGGSVAIPAPDELQDDPAGAVRSLGVNFAFLTPTVVRALLTPDAVAGLLESIVLLGERMTDDVMDTWRRAVMLFNGYGPSECSIAATIQRHLADRPDLEANNIGKPSGCRVWIVDADDHSQLVPLGCAGEICIEGPILARGYFGSTGSESPFVEHISGFFGTDTVKRLYRTGDIGRMNLDGSITILGRRDLQGKLRGQRLELGEIESCIKASREIPDKAIVVAEIAETGGGIGQSGASKMLIAFICFDSNANLNPSEPPRLVKPSNSFSASSSRIQQHLKRSLPAYMVPSILLQVSHIPSNLGGKMDRQALRRLVARPMEELAPYFSHQSQETKRSPSSLTEFELRRLWSRVLGIAEESIGLDDDWLKLGGHSLNAAQLASIARSESERLSMLNTRMVLRHPILHDMAEAAEKACVAPRPEVNNRDSPRSFSLVGPSASTTRQTAALSIGVDVAMIQDIFPPTPLQEAMLATSLQKPGSYLNTFAYRLPGSVKLDRLRTVFEALVAKNDILRARLCLSDEKTSLVILQPEAAFSWEMLEARDFQEVRKHTAAAVTKTGDPLSRFTEVHLTGGHIFLVWSLHHACYDRRSVSLMLDQIERLYHGHPSTSPPQSFSVYISWYQQQQLTSKERGQEFWKSYLSEPAVSRFPFRDVREPEPNGHLRRSFDCESHPGQSHGATDATVLRASWALVLSSYYDAPDVCWGMTLSGRDGEMELLSDVVGPTLTTIPVRVSIRPDETVPEFLRRVQRDANETAEFGQIGIQNIAKLSASARAACRFNTRQVISLTEPEDVSNLSLLGIAPVSEQVLGTEGVNHLDCALVLECTITIGKGTLQHHVSAHFDDKAISRAEVDAMMDCFELITRQLHEPPGCKTVGEIWTLAPDSKAISLADYTVRGPRTLGWETNVLGNQLGVLSKVPQSLEIVSSLSRRPVPRGAIGELRVREETHKCADTDTGYLARLWRNDLQILGRKENKRYVDGDIVVLEEVECAVQAYLPGARVAAEVVSFHAPGCEPELRLVCFIGKHNGDISGSLAIKTHQTMLQSGLPSSLVPAAFVLQDVPCLSNGQVDRRSLQNLANDLPRSKFLGLMADETTTEPRETEANNLLFQLCAGILGLKLDQILPWSTFIGLGGDSMTAIHLAARLRAHDMQLSVADILRHQSLSSLAAIMVKVGAKPETRQLQYGADDVEPIPLCPMQNLFFQLSPEGCNHFNQSLLLRLSESVTVSTLEQALRSLFARHDALRARFQPSKEGWQQSFVRDASPVLGVCDISGDAQLKKEVSRVQQSLDIQNGPVFSSQVFRRPAGDNLLFLVAHHLIIDLFSWRVLVDDLQAFLSGKTSVPVSLSWPSFCRLQALELSAHEIGTDLSAGDFPDFWDMRDKPNLFSDTVSNSTVLDEALTQLFLADSNRALGTEPVELLASSLLVSFLEAFSQERTEGRVFLESHGRDMLDVDASQTLGWFTTLSSLSLDRRDLAGNADALFQGVRRIKDCRRRTHRRSVVVTAQGLSEGDLSLPIEILMNYQGTATWSLGHEEGSGLLSVATDLPDVSDLDISPNMPRIALIEISAAVEGGHIRLSMQHNRHMRQQDRINDWFRLWVDTLTSGLPVLAALEPSSTLADFPLLSSYDYADLDRLGRVELPSRNLSFADVQDILPCSTVQEGILVSQSGGVGEYVVRTAWEVHGSVTPGQLEQAWLAVVQRHESLRTLFFESTSSFVQLVLKSSRLTKLHRTVLKHGDEICNLTNLAAAPPPHDTSPPHCLSIMTTPWDGLEHSRTFIVLAINHAIVDGDSMDVILREMAFACSGTLKPGPGPSYSSFIALQMKGREASAEYWSDSLQDAIPTRFPGRQVERGNKRAPRSAPSHVEAVINFSPRLQTFCRGSGVTISDVSLAAWAIVLSLYTGCRAPVFGYLFSGRQGSELPEVQDAVGVYLSMLVARVPLDSPGLSIEEAVTAAHNSVIRDIQHAHCSLADLQHRAGESLFNTGISVRHTATHNSLPDRRGPVSFELKESSDPTEFDVSISISIGGGGGSAAVSMAYWPDAVPRFQVQDALRLFVKTMYEIAHNPSDQVQNLLQRLAIENSDAETWQSMLPSPPSRSIVSLIQEQADVDAAAPAVHSWDGDLSYAQLLEESTRLAAELVSRGVRAGHHVPVCFDKSMWYVVAVVGVLMSGAGFVPLDPTLPTAVISQRLQTVSARVCITSRAHHDSLSQFTDVLLLPESIRGDDSSLLPPQFPETELDAVAYIIFTSGSTGTPKSVAISHGALTSSCSARRGPMGFGPGCRVLQFASHGFDVSVDEILLTLISGGCVCVPSEAQRDNLAETLVAMKVNTAMLTCSVARMLLSGLKKSDASTLRHLILGGEVVSREDIAAWSLYVPRLDIVYGPTECAIASTLLPFVPGPEAAGCLGKPIGCAVWLVDPEDETRLVPDGCTGEILIEGHILASEYLGDPERTAAAFIRVPPAWAGSEHDNSRPRRVFRTGDLAWRDGSGVLHFEGRKDNQLKVNGLRIEPESVEWNIRQVWPSSGCQVVVDLLQRASDGGGLMLAAFVNIPSPVRHKSPQDLRVVEVTQDFGRAAQEAREKLSSLLPAYMIPAIFIPVNHIPVSASGKTDRRRFKDLVPNFASMALLPRGEADAGGDSETKTETELKEQWAQVLGVPRKTIGLGSNFFQVGGDSITALRLASAVQTD